MKEKIKNNNDPLSSLFKDDTEDVNRKQLAALVTPFLSIDKGTKNFSFLPEFEKIKRNTLKIEILLAGAKARSLYLNDLDGLLPVEMVTLGIMPEGSIKSSLKKLSGGHKIKKDKSGRYYLPSYRVSELVEFFKSN